MLGGFGGIDGLLSAAWWVENNHIFKEIASNSVF
jgi:hypothetical protein